MTEADRELMRVVCDANKENIDPLASRRLPLSKKKSESGKKHRKPKRKMQSAIDSFLSEQIINVVSSHINENDSNRIPLNRRSIVVQGARGVVRTPFAELSRTGLHRLI